MQEIWVRSLGQEDPLEKAMASHSSTLAWKIPWMEEPGGLQSMGSLRVGHDWATSLSLCTFMHWRRKWQPTPVFLPGESQGRGSLVGCRLWGCRVRHDWSDLAAAAAAALWLEKVLICSKPHLKNEVDDNTNTYLTGLLWELDKNLMNKTLLSHRNEKQVTKGSGYVILNVLISTLKR